MASQINGLVVFPQICHQDQPQRHKSPTGVTRVRSYGSFGATIRFALGLRLGRDEVISEGSSDLPRGSAA